jgi:hypothetical protein
MRPHIKMTDLKADTSIFFVDADSDEALAF